MGNEVAETPAAKVPARPAAGQLTPAERLMFGLMIVVVGGGVAAFASLHRSIVDMQRQIGGLRADMHEGIGGLRADMHEEIGGLRADMHELRTDLERQISGLRTDLVERIGGVEQRMVRLEAIMEIHFAAEAAPADGNGAGGGSGGLGAPPR